MKLGLCGTPSTDEGWEQMWKLLDQLSGLGIPIYGSSRLSGAFSRRQRATPSPLPIGTLRAAEADHLPLISDLLVLWGGSDDLLDRLKSIARQGTTVLLVGESGVFPAVSEEEVAEGVCQILRGKGAIDSRMLLESRLRGEESSSSGREEEETTQKRRREDDEHQSRGVQETGLDASPEATGCVGAGEVLFHRGDQDTLLEISLKVDGRRLTRYQADGVLIATPTGSAGHSLSAGGPLVTCGTNSLVITPLASHTLTTRPLLLSGSCVIEARVESRSGSAFLCVDRETRLLESGDVVAVGRHSTDLHLACPRLMRPESGKQDEPEEAPRRDDSSLHDCHRQENENGHAALDTLPPVTTSDFLRRRSPFPDRNAARDVFSTGREISGPHSQPDVPVFN